MNFSILLFLATKRRLGEVKKVNKNQNKGGAKETKRGPIYFFSLIKEKQKIRINQKRKKTIQTKI